MCVSAKDVHGIQTNARATHIPTVYQKGATMSFRCADVPALFAESKIRVDVIAGAERLDNAVRWVYCADSMDSPLATLNWITGHELVVFSGSCIAGEHDPGSIIVEYIKRCAKKHVAGVVINVGDYIPKIPEEAIRVADRLGLPLMVVPWETRFVEFTKAICTAIVEQAMLDESNDTLANELLFGEYPLSGNAKLLLEQNGFDRAAGYYVVICRCIYSEHVSTKKQIEYLSALSEYLQAELQRKNASALFKKLGDSVITILHANDSEESYADFFFDIVRAMKLRYPDLRFHVGIGRVCRTLAEIPESYKSAQQVLDIYRYTDGHPVATYDDIGVYSLLLAVHDESVLREYYTGLFAPLIEYDKGNNTVLLSTLFAYVENDASLTQTAKALYIHENTLKYRLNRIRSLMNIDPSRLEDQVRISIGMKIGLLSGLSEVSQSGR